MKYLLALSALLISGCAATAEQCYDLWFDRAVKQGRAELVRQGHSAESVESWPLQQLVPQGQRRSAQLDCGLE